MTRSGARLALWTLAAVGVIGSGGCTPEPSVEPAGPRAIVLVSIDTLRADHLGSYGYPRPTSPFLDALAARGVLFEQAVSPAPWTLPAHASMLTGLHTSGHGAVEASTGISPSVTTAAEVFRDAGFATGAVVASWFVSRGYGFDRGFDWFEDFGAEKGESLRRKVRATTVVDEAARWLKQHRHEDLFLFVHLYDVHYDYGAPAPWDQQFTTGYDGPRPRYRHYGYYRRRPLSEARLEEEVAQYDGEIRYVDAELERLWGVLEGIGRASSTLFVVTADHGEEFFERGSWGHAHTLHAELMHVPLIMAGPGVAGGRRVDGLVRLVDLLPTLVSSAGLETPEGLDGESLQPLLAGRDVPGDDPSPTGPALLESYRFRTRLVGLQRAGWKLVSDLVTNEDRLYSLDTDPGERVDRADQDPEELAAMRAEMKAAVLATLPDRWSIDWSPGNTRAVRGEIVSDGRFIEAVERHGSRARSLEAGGRRLQFELDPGASLELAVLPASARLTLQGVRESDGEATRLLTGSSPGTVSQPDDPVTVSGADWPGDEKPALEDGVVRVWLERGRRSPEPVELDEETRERLRALGYTM